MSTKSSLASVMAWNWIIQSLAIFKQVDPSTLAGVVNKSPVIPDDLGKDSREIVYLRILESLFIDANEATIDTNSTQSDKISFDPSEHCEDVLNRILKETSEPMTELERQKWDIRPFITHKRASLTKTPLQKLKEELLEGSHPLLASLKEQTNLEFSKESEKSQNTFPEVNVDINDQTTPLEKPDQVDNSTSKITENIESKENEISIEPPVKGLEEKGDANIDHGQQELTGQGHDDNAPNLSNSDSEKSDDEMNDILAKKEAFLNSQYTLSQDSMATMESTEITLCMKCNKGGQLSVCSSDTCQVRVHNTCLDSSTTLDKNGKFLCPFCEYSQAISNFLEFKKKTSLARKDLQAFMGSKVKNRPSKKVSGLDRKKSTESEKVKVNGEGCSVSKEDNVPNDDVEICLKKGKRKCNEEESNVFSRPRRSNENKVNYMAPNIPLIWRNKLQWTKQEEDMLKEGVQRFLRNNNDNKNISWVDILDYGRDVFHKSRTTVDLKDKWRNICKGNPTTKKQKL